jgi:hypothetical protein
VTKVPVESSPCVQVNHAHAHAHANFISPTRNHCHIWRHSQTMSLYHQSLSVAQKCSHPTSFNQLETQKCSHYQSQTSKCSHLTNCNQSHTSKCSHLTRSHYQSHTQKFSHLPSPHVKVLTPDKSQSMVQILFFFPS